MGRKGGGHMSLTPQRINELDELCREFRIDVLDTIHQVQSGHTGGSFSVCEILTVIYLECADVTPEWKENRDRVILSKGHAAPMLYRVLAEKGFFPKEELKTLRQPGSRLQGHPCAGKTPGVELTTGMLGLGLSAAVGMAVAEHLRQSGAEIFCVLGDGELNEGTIWEAAMSAVKFQCDNLIAVLDWNKVQLDGVTETVMPMRHMAERWESFGWNVFECDGHRVSEIYDCIQAAKGRKNGKPSIVLANTVKGKGVSFMEGTNKYHGKAITDEEYVAAMKELRCCQNA